MGALVSVMPILALQSYHAPSRMSNCVLLHRHSRKVRSRQSRQHLNNRSSAVTIPKQSASNPGLDYKEFC